MLSIETLLAVLISGIGGSLIAFFIWIKRPFIGGEHAIVPPVAVTPPIVVASIFVISSFCRNIYYFDDRYKRIWEKGQMNFDAEIQF